MSTPREHRGFYYPQELWVKVQALAAEQDRSASYIVAKALKEYMERQETKMQKGE
jgi:predicted transcriptional regulator